MSGRRYDTADPVALSQPERVVNRKQGLDIAAVIVDAGGCWYCTHRNTRTEGWGRAVCGKVVPATFMREGCEFELDHEQGHHKGTK